MSVPDLRCENPTLPGCATPDDRLRWFGNDVADWVVTTYASRADVIALVSFAVCVVLAIAYGIRFLMDWHARRSRRHQFTEDDIIGDDPLDKHFPYLRKQEDQE